MPQSNFFLRTKLLPPRVVADLLSRPRLTRKLESHVNSPMTIVAAEAGCGKTTLLADFVKAQDRPFVWYQLDKTDADPTVFLTYICNGIREISSGFGENVFPYLADANQELLRFPERAADLLINEILESVEQPFILVLDDYHNVARESVVHTMVDRIVDYSSDLLHVVVASRDLPPLAIARRRTQSSVLMITRDDLMFTDDEVRELFRKTLNVEFLEDELVEYRNRTHGWITAIQLIKQIAEHEMHVTGGDGSVELRKLLHLCEKDIFDYFAEEVFHHEAEQNQSAMMYFALLDSMQLEACSSLYPEYRPSATLPDLARKNVFLTAAGETGKLEEYRFHPLFRDFLRRRLRSEIGSSALAAERTRIAEYFIGARQSEVAIQYLLEADNNDRASEIVAKIGQDWIASGAIISLGLLADQIAVESLEKFPRSLLVAAEVALLKGEFEKSQKLLDRALQLFSKLDDSEGEAEAFHSLATISRRLGKSKSALDLLDKSEALISKQSPTFMKCANTRGLCLIVENNWNAAEQSFRSGLEVAESLQNEHFVRLFTHNLALAPGFRGDFSEALRWFKKLFHDEASGKQLPQDAVEHLRVGRIHLYRGEFDESEKHLNQALELCQLYNLRFLRGEIFEVFANLYRDKGDFARADEYYERAANAYEEAEIEISLKEFYEERSHYYRLAGEYSQAREILENLIQTRKERGNETGVRTAQLRLYQIRRDEGETESLIDQTKGLIEHFRRENHHYFEALASMLLAEIYFALDNREEMLGPLHRSLELSKKFDYEYWLRWEVARNPKMFEDDVVAKVLPIGLPNAFESPAVVTAAGSKLKEIHVSIPNAPQHFVNDLTIKVLGPVNIHRDSARPFAADAWTTRRSRDIFCFIATSKHRRAPKDVLIDAFWKFEEIDKVEKNFHPTISHIRKALNSNQAYKQNFIIFRDGAYQLNPDLSYSIDSETFETHVNRAESAKGERDTATLKESLEAAYSLYRGQFMDGVFDSWAEDRRLYYSEQYSRVLRALARLAAAEKRWPIAIKHANEILRDDPYREDIHRLLMRVYAGQSKPASIKKSFESLTDLLDKDLGIEPSAETFRLYKDLMETNQALQRRA